MRQAIPIVPLATLVAGTKGRGAHASAAHRFEKWEREACDDGWWSDAGTRDPAATGAVNSEDQVPEVAATALPRTEVMRESARSILTRNTSPDIGFEVSINPYRGCEHGCSYCYARPTHAYLDLSPGLDFETRIVAKMNAAALLRQAFDRPGYVARPLALGTVTDAYQPVERRLRLTRDVVEVLAQYRHAFAIVTKSALVERDLDLIAPMAAQQLAAVHISLTTLDEALARRLEPRAASPRRRLQTIERLARSGVPVGVSVSPLIPFLNEPELETILQAAAQAGASTAFSVVLRLPWELAPLFREWLQRHVPDRAQRIMARVQDMRGGRDNDPRFGTRMTGQGPWAALMRQRFEVAARRHGLLGQRVPLDLSAFRRATEPPLHEPAPAGPRKNPVDLRASSPGQAELF
jgi:DNA repair photolyase